MIPGPRLLASNAPAAMPGTGSPRHRVPGEIESGGGGNRTPVRKHSIKGYYTLSTRFNLAAAAPVHGVRCGQPGRFRRRASWRQRDSDPN